jgi:signal transduction histidine kinase
MAAKLWPVLKGLLIAVVAFGAMLTLTHLPLVSLLEIKSLDLLFLLRGRLSPPPEIVIVAIDEPSFAEISRQWPWPRSIHARLIEHLNKAGAKVIGFDVLFAEGSEDPAEDQALERAIREAGNVVLVSEHAIVDDPLFRHTIRVDPIPSLKQAAEIGVATLQIDPDGIVRRTKLSSSDLLSFPLQIVRRYLTYQTKERKDASTLAWKQWTGREVLINYLGPSRTIKTVSYYQALNYEHMLPPGVFAGKIVLVGQSLNTVSEPQHMSPDTFLTPFSLVAEGPSSGVEIQATIVANLLQDNFIGALGTTEHAAIVLVIALIGSLMLLKIKPLNGLIAIVVVASLVVLIAYVIFLRAGVWLPIFPATMELGLVYAGHLVAWSRAAERERRQVLEEMNRSLEEKVAKRTEEISAAHQELTERHQQLEKAYQELARAEEQLIQSEKMASLGLLVAGVAHELNNPISFVHGNLEFIEEYVGRLTGIIEAYGVLDKSAGGARRRGDEKRKTARLDNTLETLRELIASCKQGTERVKKIVMDLRTFSRTDDIGLVQADLHQGIDSTLNLLEKEYRGRIRVHREYGDLPPVECYPGQVNQVFMNLLQNAAQAIDGQGEVWIRTTTHGEWVKIAIEDNGCGIPEQDLPRIFDPFFTTKPIGKGTGLGLSITYGIIQKHGGRIEVKSETNKGTEFIVELPARLSGERHEALRAFNRRR